MADTATDDLSELNREELDERAIEAGVEDPEKLPNKQAVIDAINNVADDDEDDNGAASAGPGEVEEQDEVLRTSDAAAHVEGVSLAEVEPDLQTGEKSTDRADYQFPVGGDVDVATLPDDKLEGESEPPIQPDSWVKLGDTENVPEENQGAVANIVSINTDDEEHPVYQVRTRDENNSILWLEKEDFADVYPGGVGLRGVGP